jgi:hypothetical protein
MTTTKTKTASSRAQQKAQQERAKRALARRWMRHFVPYMMDDKWTATWFHDELLRKLDKFIADVRAGKTPRLMIFVPPRHGKTMCVSEFLPAFVLGQWPEAEVIMATYNQSLADKRGKRVRSIFRNPRYQRIFDTTLEPGSQAADYMLTTAGGMYKTTGIGGELTGLGYNIGIVDDPVKGFQDASSKAFQEQSIEWYTGEFLTRGYGAIKGYSGIIILQTRWHDLDLSGQILDYDKQVSEESGEPSEWEVIEYPAIATHDEEHRKLGEPLCPAIMSLGQLMKIKRADKTGRVWPALYQQNPTPPDGLLAKKAWAQWHAATTEDFISASART